MKLVISADHAGFPLKEDVRAYLTKKGHELVDLGAYDGDHPDDYPDFAEKVGDAIKQGVSKRGILICGSGVGVCVAANKIPGIRAGMCHDTYVIVLGARIIASALAYECVDAFVGAKFIANEERFKRRFNKVLAIEAKYQCGDGSASPA
jgi:ribose 5-phosphate isomerase B